MTRIFGFTALFALVFVAATMLLGLSLGDVRDPADRPTQQWATVHRLSGLAASLCVLLVNAIVVTYFIGTSRWCREVVDTYRLDPQMAAASNRLKRRAFPNALVSMLVAVGIVASGGAADPAAALRLAPVGGLSWANWHLLVALAGMTAIAWTFFVEWTTIQENHQSIERILAAVKQVRQERGLEV